MKTITKTELKENVNYKCYPAMNDDEKVNVRGKLKSLTYLNTCYRDTNGKVYVEDNISAIERLIKRMNRAKMFDGYSFEWDMYLHERLEFCLSVGEWDFSNAMQFYFNTYC